MITEIDIQKYLDNNYPKHLNYDKTVSIAKELQVHSKGNVPIEILNLDRPNEPVKYKEYRSNKAVISPITKSKWGQISSTTDKISMAEDWSVKFPESLPSIKKGETLEDYTTINYPYFDSVLNWYFKVCKKAMEDDPNGVIAIFPFEEIKSETEYIKPFAFIYPSECIIEYRESEFCAILCKEKSLIKTKGGFERSGNIFIFFDKDTLIKAVEKGVNSQNKPVYDTTIMNHNIGDMPVFKLGGVVKSFEDNQILYDSFYAPVVPYFNEAIARYSDHQVNMMLHLHPDRWEVMDHQCKSCNGSGYGAPVQGKVGKTSCIPCNGMGFLSVKSPFGEKQIRPQAKTGVNEVSNIPTPPMGYILRPIESIAFLKKEVKDLINEGFESINLGFINEEPQVNSGVSKALDRQEMNAFFSNISKHIVENALNPIFYFINEWRNKTVIPSKTERDKLKPIINVPTKFDILTADILATRLQTAITSKFDSTLLTRMQIEYAEKELGKYSPEIKKMKAIADLDPLPNKIEDEKMVILSNKGTSEENYILSCNIVPFVNRAYSENDKFFDLKYKEKKDLLLTYVQEIVKSNKDNIIPLIQNGFQATRITG